MINNVINNVKFKIRHNSALNGRIKLIEDYYALSDTNIENLKNQTFLQLIKTAFNNTFYKSYYAEHGVSISQIKNIEDLSILPKITKQQVKDNINQIKQHSFLFKGYTSGTSGAPLVIYRDLNSILNENAYVWWYRTQCGLHWNDKKISLRGDLGKSKLFITDKASNTLFISSFSINKSTFPEILQKITEFKPKALVGYPSSLAILATFFLENDKHLNIPLGFTSSETLYPHQEKLIKDAFETNVFDWYGNSERTIALYRENKKYYEPLLYSVNVYKKKCVLTTSLINKAFPLINYEVNDVISSSNNYSHSKKSMVIDKIEGRTENYVILSDGSKIGSAALSLVFKEMDILNSQIIQDSATSLVFNIVPGKKFTDEQELYHKITAKLGGSMNIRINKITENDIIYTNSGKFNLVISNIKNS